MGQPVKKTNKDKKNTISNEVKEIITHIKTKTYLDYRFKEITPTIFILGVLECSEISLCYKILNTLLSNRELTDIYDKISIYVTEGNQAENNGIIKGYGEDYDPPMSDLLKECIKNCKKDIVDIFGLDFISSDVVLCMILKNHYTCLSEYIYGVLCDMGITFSSFSNAMVDFRDTFGMGLKPLKKDDTEEEKEKFKQERNAISDILSKKVSAIAFQPISEVIGIYNNTYSKSGENIQYCTNLNDMMLKKKFDALIGRKDIINTIYISIERRKTNNAILVGDDGVGKTQIVYGIVDQIIKEECPFQLRNKVIYKLNPSEIVGGTTCRGMFEERIVKLMSELKRKKNAILFIDDMELLFNESERNNFDNGGDLSQLLSGGEVQVIATTTKKGYKTISDASKGIISKFQKIDVEEMSENETIEVITKTKEAYEKFHGVYYNDAIIKECVGLCKKYITEKKLPLSAIEIIDELGAYKKLTSEDTQKLNEISNEIKSVKKEMNVAVRKDNFDKVKECEEKINTLRLDSAIYEDKLKSGKKINITEEDLYQVFSNHTGIPTGKIKQTEKETLKNIKNTLGQHIIGQNEAIDVVTKAIKRNKIGLNSHNRPILNALFLGSTGTGKTLLAKELSREMFGDEKYLIRFDMSEYKDKTSINKLIGASAGYVGYQEGGLLTEAVKNNKYAVLLMDEIEKADESIYNLFLQVMDEGFLTDNRGEKVDFRNTMIILTSNIGAKEADSHSSIGFNKEGENENKKDIIKHQLKNKFPPEFINRLDEIVYFNNLTEENLKKIIELELNKTKEKLFKIGYNMVFDQLVIDYLYTTIEKEKNYGARPIIRSIRENIENKITDLLIDNEYKENYTFEINVINNKIEIK